MSNVREKQKIYFPQKTQDSPWTQITSYKRYGLTMPCYPFRTLSHRELFLRQTKPPSNRFNTAASCLFPANTQLNVTFHRRPLSTNFLDFLLPENLDTTQGSLTGSLTTEQRKQATRFSVPATAAPAAAAAAAAAAEPGATSSSSSSSSAAASSSSPSLVSCTIHSVAINIQAIYLQVYVNDNTTTTSGFICWFFLLSFLLCWVAENIILIMMVRFFFVFVF